MKKLLKILIANSLKELFRHSSFFLLMFIIIVVDRALKLLKETYQVELDFSFENKIDMNAAIYLFEKLPAKVTALIKDHRFFIILAGLFLIKQIISLWPSSDMRRMHRRERERFGLIASLKAIRWQQLVWDSVAISTLCLAASAWCVICFSINRIGWYLHPSLMWFISFMIIIAAIFPIILAGFSYSSKLAVISKGTFREKLRLFYKLFFDWRIAGGSWLFYSIRIILEAVFVVAIPAYILITVDIFLLRIFLAALLATPVYSYLKMASFKFFLVLYERFPLVKQEFESYYKKLNDPILHVNRSNVDMGQIDAT
jgi:hypothetical protein